jgi:predicted Zn-dependent protease
MSKNIPKPIIRVGHIRKDGSLSYEIDGNKVKNMTPVQFTNLITELNKVRRKLVTIHSGNNYGNLLTQIQYGNVEQLVKSNNFLPAVKLYKEYTDVGLKDAKDFVDNLRESIK